MRKSDINFALTLVLPRVQQQEVKRLASGGAFTSEEREARGEGEDGPGEKRLEGYVKKHSRRFWFFFFSFCPAASRLQLLSSIISLDFADFISKALRLRTQSPMNLNCRV